MASVRINMTMSELMIEFTDTDDLERQLKNIDLSKIESLLDKKIHSKSNIQESEKISHIESQTVNDLGTVNLLKISEGGPDATKLAIFLASNKMNHDDIKRITGITLLS
jgi:aspartate carbamoyltransferase regulatory subunit